MHLLAGMLRNVVHMQLHIHSSDLLQEADSHAVPRVAGAASSAYIYVRTTV
jgi:hypothetical protein